MCHGVGSVLRTFINGNIFRRRYETAYAGAALVLFSRIFRNSKFSKNGLSFSFLREILERTYPFF